jgi:hypothetical protein
MVIKAQKKRKRHNLGHIDNIQIPQTAIQQGSPPICPEFRQLRSRELVGDGAVG